MSASPAAEHERERQYAEEMRAKGHIEVDGKWVSKEQLELEKLRAEIEAMKKEKERLHISVTVINKTLSSGTVPRWSVDHELRVNGKLVDTMTNKSTMANFETVEVKVGDKITARSMWKNGYGAVGIVYDKPADKWPTVEKGTSSYTITIRQY